MSGRTYWLKKDGAWWERGAVRRARKEFGPTGPAVMDWLECAARRQNAAGRVKADPFTIAEDIGSDEVTVCHVVSHLVQKKWLLSHEIDGDLFKAKIAWFEADQRRGDDAERKAESRANQDNSESLSRSVTESHLREEKRREEERAKALSSARPETEKASDEDRASCRLFYSLGRKRNPKMKVPTDGSPQQVAALKAMRLLRERDEQTTSDIQRLIRWMFEGESDDAEFWGTTIQAPSGLRKNFSKAWSKMDAPSLSSRPSNQKPNASDLLRKINEAQASRQGLPA